MEIEKKPISDNLLSEKIYSASLLNWNYIILGIVFLILGFALNIPIKEKVTDIITARLAGNEACPIFFERVEVGAFLQEIKILGPIISGECLGRQSSLRIDQMEANLSWPTLFPPGLALNLKLIDENSIININPTISYPKILVAIKETSIDGEFLEKLMGGFLKIKGQFAVGSTVEMENSDLLAGNLSIASTNLTIPRQTISGFNTPSLLLRNFGIKGTIPEKNVMEFSNITIGDKDSMIFTQMNGKLRLNRSNFQESKMELTGKIRFSRDFINSFPILNLLLSGKSPGPDGLYNIKLDGQLSSLKPSIF